MCKHSIAIQQELQVHYSMLHIYYGRNSCIHDTICCTPKAMLGSQKLFLFFIFLECAYIPLEVGYSLPALEWGD